MSQPLDSQERLAASIVRAVQVELPGSEASPELTRSVESTLLNEARESEASLARGRIYALGGFVVFAILTQWRPELIGLTRFPASAIAGGIAALLLAVF